MTIRYQYSPDELPITPPANAPPEYDSWWAEFGRQSALLAITAALAANALAAQISLRAPYDWDDGQNPVPPPAPIVDDTAVWTPRTFSDARLGTRYRWGEENVWVTGGIGPPGVAGPVDRMRSIAGWPVALLAAPALIPTTLDRVRSLSGGPTS